MPRTLVLALLLASTLTGCGSSHAKLTDAVVTQPSAAAPTGTCEPSGTGTTDLTKKPVYTVPTAKAPTETTVVDIVCGTGAEAVDGSAVEVKYVGVNYADGKEFDSSWARGDTLPFTLGSGVIAGFSKGTLGMKVGGRREVIIAPKDGYGDAGPVPGGTLVFLIDLVKVG
ncbi:MAG: Peptidylprolyl isomerase [Frankiales bacterium]|nr:Peptidylprolyl isomerase [Frankiales bacterium]